MGLYTAAVAYDKSGVKLIFVKSVDSVPDGDPIRARNWVESLGVGVLSDVQNVAGEQFLVPPDIISGLRKLLEFAREMLGPGGSPSVKPPTPEKPADPSTSQPAPPPGIVPASSESEDFQVEGLSPVLALRAISGLLELAATLKRGRHVTAVTLWFLTERWKKTFSDERVREPWTALLNHNKTWDGNRRIANLIWDPANSSLWGVGDPDDWRGKPPITLTWEKIRAYLLPYGRVETEMHPDGFSRVGVSLGQST